jgi:hypothetical protein
MLVVDGLRDGGRMTVVSVAQRHREEEEWELGKREAACLKSG